MDIEVNIQTNEASFRMKSAMKRNSNVTDMEKCERETRPATQSLSGTFDIRGGVAKPVMTTQSNIVSPKSSQKSSIVPQDQESFGFKRARSAMRTNSVMTDGQPPLQNINNSNTYHRISNAGYGNMKFHKPLENYIQPQSHFQRHRSARAGHNRNAFKNNTQQPYENLNETKKDLKKIVNTYF